VSGRLARTLSRLRIELERATGKEPLPGNAAIFGSAVMELMGMPRQAADLDIAVRPWLFRVLRDRNWVELTGDEPSHPTFLEWRSQQRGRLTVHAFYAWRADQPEIDLTEVLDRSVLTADNWPAAPLSILRSQKKCSLEHGYAAVGSRDLTGSRWEKHQRDLAMIDKWVAFGQPAREAA
jgi:hypothetical protein